MAAYRCSTDDLLQGELSKSNQFMKLLVSHWLFASFFIHFRSVPSNHQSNYVDLQLVIANHRSQSRNFHRAVFIAESWTSSTDENAASSWHPHHLQKRKCLSTGWQFMALIDALGTVWYFHPFTIRLRFHPLNRIDIPLSIILHDSFFLICSTIVLSILGVYRDVWRWMIIPNLFTLLRRWMDLSIRGEGSLFSSGLGQGLQSFKREVNNRF